MNRVLFYGLWFFSLLLVGCTSQEEVRLSALHHFKAGNKAYLAEDYPRAVRHMTMAARLAEGNSDIRYNLGLANYRTGNFREAVVAFSSAVKLDPMMADAHYNLALAFDKLYNRELAHAHFNTYRKLISREGGEVALPGQSSGKRKGRQPGKRTAQNNGKKGTARRPPVKNNINSSKRTTAQNPSTQKSEKGTSKWWKEDRFIQNR